MKVTVKTMDSGSEVFELPDETTVKGLRDMILSKMGISLDQQRIIFQGKVLKDEELLQNYGVDGKVIHLVKRPPPSLAGEPAGGGQGAASSATPPTEGGESGRGITVHASQDMVFVGNIPVSSRNDITQVTQNIVDQIVSSLSSHGAEAQVSAEAVTTDLSGATHTTTVSGQTGQRAEANATPPPPPPPPPPHASDASRRVPTHPTAPPPGVPSGAQQRKEPEKEEGGGSGGGGSGVGVPVESERRKRHLKNVYIHSRSVRRCLQHATRVLDRYDRSMVRVKRRREREREGKEGGEEEGEEEEKWDAVESMEVLEGGRGDGGGDEDLPSEERYPELNQPQDTAQLSASLFVRFFDEVEALQRRVRPCVLEYRRRMDEDQVINEDEVMDANRIAITVKDFNYYIGHAHVSLSRLHVSMAAPPPRTLRLTAPRRTEMRRMMQQFRPRPPGLGGPPGRDGPSGYIVDISRDDEAGGQGSERRSTRAVVNRGGGGGGRGGPPGFGGGGGPPGFGGGFPGFGGLFGSMGMMGSGRGGGEGTGGGDKEGSGAEKEPAKAEGSTSGSGGAEGGTKMEMDEGRAEGGTKMEMDEGRALFREEEVRSKNEEKNTKQEVDEKVKSKFKVEVKDDEEGKRKFKVEVKDNEEGKSKFKVEVKVDEEVKSKGSQEKEEVNEEGKKETEDGKDSGDETPQYLARLLSELITGVADPAGPYRPTNKSKEGEEKTGGDGAVGGASNEGVAPDKDVSSTTTKPSESSGSSGGKEGEEGGEGGEGRRRTFAERYAGPEGTTVTISAAPVPPFGIPGLPPMEGPSVSIKNRGDGVEPEMTINFPMPPAIQLLQGLLERAEERHRQRREAGETSSEEEEESEEEESEEETEEEKRKREEKRKELAKNRPEKAFLDEDGEIDSLSDPGSLDSIHSDDREDAPEFENQPPTSAPPTSAPPTSAPPTVPPSGERLTMLDAMEQVKSQLAPNERTINRNLGMMEEALKVISRELSVVEVMQVFKGEVGPASRLQPCLLKFVQDRLLDGKEPTRERRDGAVGVFLTGCKPALVEAECELPLRDVGLDLPATLHLLLSQICCEAYDHITANYSKKEAEGNGFGCSMRHWARHSSGLFSNVVRHCVDGEKQFEEIIEKLIGTLFPPNAPSMILDMCSGSILRELVHVRGDHPYGPQELDSYLCWKEGVLPTPNTSYDLAAYSLDQSTLHQGQMLPIPARESCPGGPGAGAEEEGNGRGSIGFPHGVPEEWVPSIKRDRASSSSSTLAGPQQPYSSAYLSGMPAKRRKQLDTSEPLSRSPQDLSFQLMEEALLETGASTVTGKSQLEMLSLLHHDDALAEAVARDVYNIQRERCASSPSFEAERYPSCAQYYKISPPKDTLP